MTRHVCPACTGQPGHWWALCEMHMAHQESPERQHIDDEWALERARASP